MAESSTHASRVISGGLRKTPRRERAVDLQLGAGDCPSASAADQGAERDSLHQQKRSAPAYRAACNVEGKERSAASRRVEKEGLSPRLSRQCRGDSVRQTARSGPSFRRVLVPQRLL